MQDTAKASNPKNYIEGDTGPWEVIVGLEVHAQVASQSKLFSGAATAFGAEPNSHVSLVDAAMPGMLPVINSECVAQAVRRWKFPRAEGAGSTAVTYPFVFTPA